MLVWGKLEGSSTAAFIFGQKDGRPLAGFVIGNLTVAVLKSEYWGWQAQAAQLRVGFSLRGIGVMMVKLATPEDSDLQEEEA